MCGYDFTKPTISCLKTKVLTKAVKTTDGRVSRWQSFRQPRPHLLLSCCPFLTPWPRSLLCAHLMPKILFCPNPLLQFPGDAACSKIILSAEGPGPPLGNSSSPSTPPSSSDPFPCFIFSRLFSNDIVYGCLFVVCLLLPPLEGLPLKIEILSLLTIAACPVSGNMHDVY